MSEIPIYQREKSLGYETIISVSGEVEKEGDSTKEIEDEAGELNAIEKHVNAVATLQSAVRAYRIRKEFQELLSGGGELIDIAKVDRAVSALRKEFKYRSAKVRRLAAQQFESSNESPWWEVEQSNAATLIPLADDTVTGSRLNMTEKLFTGTLNHNQNKQNKVTGSSDSQPNSEVNIFVLDPTMSEDNADVQDQANSENMPSNREVDEKKKIAIIQAAYKGYVVRKQFARNLKRNNSQESTDVVSTVIAEKEHSIQIHNKVESQTVLQRAFKGYLYRKHISVDEKKCSIINAAYKGYVVRKQFSRAVKRYDSQESTDIVCTTITNSETEVPIQDKGVLVTVVQSAFKAYLYRKHVSEKVSVKPGTIIQSASKGYLYKNQFYNTKNFRKAADKVQAAFKGYKMRKRSKSLLTQVKMVEVEQKSAVDMEEAAADRDYKIEKDRLSIIQAAAQSYFRRIKLLKRADLMNKQQAARKIQAAARGYIARRKLQIKQTVNLPDSMQDLRESLSTAHVTKLQAALAGYQTRKVFKSLTKLVEDGETLDVSGHKLERMGSLSETDDFKLKHKSIAKIQTALQEHRQRNLIGVTVTVDGDYSRTVESRSFATSNRQPKRAQARPSKSPSSVSFSKEIDDKERFQIASNVRKESKLTTRESRMSKVSRIENYIKLNIAASIVQASLRGYLKRKVLKKKKENNPLKRKHATSTKTGQTNMKQNGKGKARINTRTDKDVIRSQTASVKVEAERRKEIRTRVVSKESIHAVKSKAEKLRAEKETKLKPESVVGIKGQASKVNAVISQSNMTAGGISQTNKISEREVIVNINASNANDDVSSVNVSNANSAESNTSIDESNTNINPGDTKSGRDFDKEYEVWKQERIDAAVLIQSGWRGYRARKDMLRQDQTVEFGTPQKMIVINIGRSKSEIERAEQQYNNASMIQMVYRTAKIRRKIKVKMAVKRYERNQAVTKIQAYYRSYTTRKYTAERNISMRIQAVFKADIVRKHNIADKLSQKRSAASLIQASWQSFKTRQQNETEKKMRKVVAERNSASLSIQSAYRGFSERRSMLKKKIELQVLAASQIQAALRGSMYRRTVKEKRASATYIRASFKSYKKRLEVQNFKENLKARNAAATEIVCAYKAHEKREKRRIYKEKLANKKKAALHIQSALKGMIARKNEQLRKELARKQNYSALKIQSFYRGCLGRKMARVLKNEKERKEILHQKQYAAALKIQSVYRGHNGRKRARQERYKRELQQTSAEIIEILIERTISYLRQKSLAGLQLQWAVRGHLARKRNESNKEKKRIEAVEKKKLLDIAATMVQTAVKARRRRLQARGTYKLREEHKAATKIQALYRGYSTREVLEREKARLAKLSPLVISPDQDEVLRNAQAMIAFHKNATVLQGAFKAYTMRAQVRDRFHRKIFIVASTPRRENSGKLLSSEEKAAVLIQKTFRGFSDRKMYCKMIKERRRRENKASNIIKASVNGFVIRRERKVLQDKIDREGSAEVRHEKHVAANVIASAFRGYQKRKQKVALRAEM